MTAAIARTDDPVVEVRNLRIGFRTDEGMITPVDGVSFTARRGRTLGIVGESGSGKSVSTRALMKLLPRNAVIDPASVMRLHRPDGPLDITPLPPTGREIREIRGGAIAMIFQEPMASFSPVYTIGNQIAEVVRIHRRAGRSPMGATTTVGEQIAESLRAHDSKLGKAAAREIAVEMLDRVGISQATLRARQYPHELSGGMRQRAMIAAALSTHPSLLIADEPTTALDVTIQAQILNLMRDLQAEFGMSIIFITHDMGVIAQIADEVAVMYLGTIVERGPTRTLITAPKHPYTVGLLEAIPRLDTRTRRLSPVPGDIPSPLERPSGCAFRTRCVHARPGLCDRVEPAETDLGGGHVVRCLLHQGDTRGAA
jgi:peptide/nickel transport system ATP-binding protein